MKKKVIRSDLNLQISRNNILVILGTTKEYLYNISSKFQLRMSIKKMMLIYNFMIFWFQ